MKDYKSASLIWITLFLCSCRINNGDLLNIPTQVISSKTTQHENIKGTKIYVLKPKEFTYDLTSSSFVKTPYNYFRAVESPTVSFAQQRTLFLSVIEDQKKLGYTINQLTEYKQGDYNALLMYADDKKNKQQHLILLIGNENYSSIIYSECPITNLIDRDELLTILLSICIDKSEENDLSKIQDFLIDLSPTNFKVNCFQYGMFLFTPNGLGNPNDGITNMLLVKKISPLVSDSLKVNLGQKLINDYVNGGVKVNNMVENKYANNGLTGFETALIGQFKGKPISIYQIVFGDNELTYIYCGIAYENVNNYLTNFKTIGRSIKKKNNRK